MPVAILTDTVSTYSENFEAPGRLNQELDNKFSNAYYLLPNPTPGIVRPFEDQRQRKGMTDNAEDAGLIGLSSAVIFWCVVQ